MSIEFFVTWKKIHTGLQQHAESKQWQNFNFTAIL